MESVGRMFLCARCRERTVLCSSCDHGQIYCGQSCSSAARVEAQRSAGQRYQSSGTSPAASVASTMSSARGGGACGSRSNAVPAPRMLTL